MGALSFSAPGYRADALKSGFTLVEMLVVLVVLGITAALLLPQLEQDERRGLEQEAQRLAGAVEHAVALAQWRGETLGISAEGTRYRFWRRDGDGQWQVIARDEVLAARALRDGLTIQSDRYAGAAVAPDAIIPLRPSGRNEPFSFALMTRDWRALIGADPLNRVAFSIARRAATTS